MNNIICVAGPTASGKTALAVELAKEFNGEVVSCDSMYVYKRMNIGTAKPTVEEMQSIVHHMIGVAEPDEDFSVSKYCQMAAPIIDDIVARGLIKGNDFADFPSTGYRQTLEQRVEEEGVAPLLEQLYQVDPESAEHSLNNPRRIIRALEVYYETGMTITEHNRRTQELPPRYEPLWLGLDFTDRSELYRRINLRVGIMLEMGLIREIQELLASGIPPKCTAMQAIGYKEFIAALNGECTIEEAADQVRMFSRRYGKRQLTWFRRNKNIHWITREGHESSEEILAQARQIIREFDK